MREIRPSGSEGGETDSSVFPTPIEAFQTVILNFNDSNPARLALFPRQSHCF